MSSTRTARRRDWTRRLMVCLAVLAVFVSARAVPLRAQTPDRNGRFLAKEDIILFGLGLHVECNEGELPDENGITACQTVPKGYATALPTMFVAPQVPDNLPDFGPNAVILGTLRGPSFPTPIELSARPNTPFSIPPMSVPGMHSLDDIRLVVDGQVLLRGDRESALIRVIDKLLVTSVTARPLTADEERAKGLVFDRSNFQAYNFAAAFAINDNKVPISFTVVLPTLQGANGVNDPRVTLPGVGSVPGLPSLQTVIPDSLKQLSLAVPNLNVVGFTLNFTPPPGQNFFVPPIPGVIVIPGDIGFLDQFFSIMLMVGNVAPAGSGLVVSDLSAEIVLPLGDDEVANSPDDPLRMGRTDKGETPRTQPVTQPGPDNSLGTADDIKTIGPGETGNAEFLVEGKREGTHVVEMRISGTLHGLPIGPVPVTGIARGAVLVRNPTFTLTFTHPEVVSAGEPYTLDVTVTNTSASPANLVSLNLYPRFVTGATIVGDSTRNIDSIPPGDSATVSYDLVAQVSGKVTAATFSADDQVAGRFILKTSVGELGIPLSPDSLVLPKEANSLAPSLRAAAIGLLGKAWAVATAPTAALPKDISRFSKKVVIDHAVDVAEAGFRVSLHEPTGDNAAQLLMDFMGSNFPRLSTLVEPSDLDLTKADFLAFDDLRRRSVRGDVFAQAVAALLQPDLASQGAAAFHHNLAEKLAYRPPHLSVLVTSDAGTLPVSLTLVDSQGHKVGGVDAQGKYLKEIPFSDYLPLVDGSGVTTGQLAMVAAPDAGDFTVQLARSPDAPDGATYTISLVVPDATGQLRQLVFSGVPVTDTPVTQFAGSDPYRVTIQVTANGAPVTGTAAGPPTASPVADLPPSIVGVVQQAAADQVCIDPGKTTGLWRPGRVIAVLFSEEVTAETVQDKLDVAKITNYALEDNQVVGVALQPGGRIALIALRDPVGPFVPRTISISDVADLRGNVMSTDTKPIEATVTDPGGVVSGRILHADGTPIPFASVRLFYACLAADTITWVGISQKPADANGHYQWDYVVGAPKMLAVDPETDDNREARFNIARNGQQLNVDLIMLGRGTVQGTTLGEDGTPLKDSKIKVTSLTDQSSYGATTDAAGRFTIARVPVGNVLVEAVNTTAQAQFSISDVIPFAGATIDDTLVLLTVDSPKQITVKKVTLTAHVARTDNGSISGLPVVLYYTTGSQTGVNCPSAADECAVAVGTTDADGAYVFTGAPAGQLRVHSFDQVTLEEGDASSVLAPDAIASVTVILGGGVGTVKGVVLDPDGNGVPDARIGGGYSLAHADATGHFTLTDMPLGIRQIYAVSDALQSTGSTEVQLTRAGEEVQATILLDSHGTVKGTLFRLDGTPAPNVNAYLFQILRGKVNVVGVATSDGDGHYTMDAVPLGEYSLSAFTGDFSDGNIVPVAVQYNGQVVKADLTFRGGNGGVIHGTIVDSDGNTPLKGRVSISGIQPVIAGGRAVVGFEPVQNYQIVDTNLSGAFTLTNIWPGDITVRAAGVFSPDPISLAATMPAPTTTLDMTIRLEPTSQIAGTVYQPDGVTPVKDGIVIHYKSDGVQVFCSETSIGETSCTSIPKGIQELNAVTQIDGTFLLPIVTAGPFTLTITDNNTGHSARVRGSVRAGERAELSPRLLGLADVNVHVFTSDLQPVPGATVDIKVLDDPDRIVPSHTADASGVAHFAGGDALPEGGFTILASDVQHGGASGRGSGKVVADGQTVDVNVYLYTSTGVVSGTVFRADGAPAPNAQVIIANSDGPLTYTISDANGGYRLDQIPINKAFTVDAFDPITAAHGSGSGTIFLAGQEVPVVIHEDALAVVTGTVLDDNTKAPLKGWQVRLIQTAASGVSSQLITTSGIDGGFRFPGAAVGPFTLQASKGGVQGSGNAAGTVDRPGQAVDVLLPVKIQRPSFGTVTGVVMNSDGSLAVDAQVDICVGSCEFPIATITSDHTTAEFSVPNVPLTRVQATARTQDGLQTGTAVGEITFDGEAIRLVVVLAGISQISGTVTFANGQPAANASLVLILPGAPAPPPRPGAADDNGVFTFTNVSARSFSIVATDLVSQLKGSASDLLTAGQQKQVQIVLQPSGTVTADVQTETGNPAVGVAGELVIGQRHFFAETGANGTITFDALPIGQFSLTLVDPLGIGIAKRFGNVTGPVDLGAVKLDSSRPAVATITPAPSSTGVSHDSKVTIVFSEALNPATVTTSTVVLSNGTTTVPGTVALSDDEKTVTFSPLSTLADQTKFSVRVTGVRDVVDHDLSADYVSSFTTADIAPPTVTQFDPSPNASGVNIYAPIRIAFSEPIDTAKFRAPPSLVLTAPDGPVAGRLDYLFGGTVVVFTPNIPLRDQTVYHLQAPAAIDLAGNAMPQAIDFDFATTDRTPPTIDSLTAANNGHVIQGTVTSVTANVGTSHDLAFVDFYLNGVFSGTVQAPYVFNFQAVETLGGPGEQIQVSAIATDTSGNRGIVPAVTAVTIDADQPPTVAIAPSITGNSAANGQRVDFVVTSGDDVGVQKVSFRAKTGKAADAASHVVNPPTKQHSDTFGFNVPNEAAPGSTITSEFTVLDTKGQATTSTFDVVVLDSIAPTVTMSGAASGDKIRPGQQLTVVVSVQDVGGIKKVTFNATGVANSLQSKQIDPAQTSIVTSFIVTVPSSAQPPASLTINVTAEDNAGNVGSAAPVILPVADNVPPTITSFKTSNGALQIVPGTQVSIVVNATDDIGVSRVDIVGQGAFSVSDGKQILPPLAQGSATFAIQVPANAAPGSILTLTATAGDLAQNISAPAALALTVVTSSTVTLPPSLLIDAGAAQDVTVQLSDPAPAGGRKIDFSSNVAVATVTPTSITVPAGQTAGTISVAGVATGLASIDARIDGVVRGSMTVTVTGGIVRGTVRDTQLAPVANATVAVADNFTTVTVATDGSGQFIARGVNGPAVTVKAFKDIDQTTRLLGFATAQMNRYQGYAVADVVLIEAGVIHGTAFAADGQTPVGAGVQVDLYEASNPTNPIATTFTVDQTSRFEFPLVAMGNYVVVTSQASTGRRGRATTSLVTSGQEVDLSIPFLGTGTVTVTVKDGAGVPVNGATVKLYSFTVFGSTPLVTQTADGNGVAVFSNVPQGTFRVDANDQVSGRGGSASGEITSDQQQVAKDITISSFGSLEGTVFRPDGVTPVGGASVTANGLTTETDTNGHYSIAFLSLGTVNIVVHDAASRGQGAATTTLTQQGVTKTVDVVLMPQGALAVTVKDANGNLVSGAQVTVSVFNGSFRDTLSGTTGSNGLVIIGNVLAGSFTITARSGVLGGGANGTLAANEQKSVTITLQPTASIAGLVTAPNDAPVTEGSVFVENTGLTVQIQQDGTYRIDGLIFGNYGLRIYDAANRLRAKTKTAIVLAVPNQVVQANFKMVGLGSVTGRVQNPDASSAQNLAVQVRALNPDFGSFTATTTDAGGFYTVNNLAAGDVTVSASNPTLHLRAEGAGTITQDGQQLTIPLQLANNLTDLPTSRWDASNFLFDVQKDGSLLSGTSNVFAGTTSGGTWGASLLDVIVNGTASRFTGASFGTTEDGGREVVVNQNGVGGLNVTRKIFVPSAGYFARYLEVLSNPTDQPIFADILVTSHLVQTSGAGTQIVTTSSGDGVLDVSNPASADRWVVIDDPNHGDPFSTGTEPTTAFVFDGTAGAQHAADATFGSANPQLNGAPQRLTYGWNSVAIPANATIAFLHFTVQQVGPSNAQASAERLIQLPPEALSGLSSDELAEIQNFAAPADGLSTLAALPPVTGTISGRVLASNNTTPVGSSTVRLQSSNALFGRTFSATSAADGSFTFAGVLADNGQSKAVPADAFTLQADHPQAPSIIKSPVTNGAFADGALQAQQDVAFTNTGLVHGVVLLNGAPLNAVQVSAAGTVGQTAFNFATTSAADGSFTFPLLPIGQVTLSATASLPLGGTKTGTTVATVAGSETIEAPIGIDTIAPQITITSPAPNASIDPRSALPVSVSATDQGGVTQVTLQASGIAAFSETRTVSPAAGSDSEQFSIPFATLPPQGGTLTLTATARDGSANQGSASPVAVSILDVVAPTIALVTPANGAVAVEPTSSVIVQFSEPVARPSITSATMSLTLNGTAVPVSYAFNDNDRSVTMAPTQTLGLNKTYTVTVTTAVTDVAGNALGAASSTSFKTKSPDATSPRVSTIVPANGAVNVPVGTAVDVTFTEPIDRTTINPASFQVTITGAPVAGHFAFASNDAEVLFVPDAPLPFDALVEVDLSAAITDLFQNPLADAAGNPLTTPLIFTFATGTFGITSPAQGTAALENAPLTLEAQASPSLGIATVAFTVNGQALTPVTGPPFTATFTVGSAATTPTLTVLAIGTNAGGTEVARDQVTVPVVAGLRGAPSLLGVPLGGSARLRLFIPAPLATDVAIQLAAVDSAIAAPAVSTASIPAGQTETFVNVNGAAVGSTTITATSSRGTAWTIASVSQPVSKTIAANALPALVVTRPGQLLGRVFIGPSAVQAFSLPLLTTPASADTVVTIVSSNPAVASVTGTVTIAAGSTTASVPITTGVAGTATLTLSIGNVTTQLRVAVGPPFSDMSPVTSDPVGVVLLPPPSLGRAFIATTAQSSYALQLLSSPAGAATAVSVTSSDPAIAQVVGSVTIAAGSQSASVTIQTGTAGTATLTFVAGSEVRVLTVVVGAAQGSIPGVSALPVGFVWLPALSAGRVFTPVTGQMTVNVQLLSAPAATTTAVGVTSSDANIATVSGSVTIAAGSQTATVTLLTGVQGTATITFVAAGERRELTVIVGTPPANLLPVVSARPVGVVVLPASQSGKVYSAVSGQTAVTVPLLAAPAGSPVPVSVSSSNPSIANVVGSPTIAAGSRSATLNITAGGQGVATLTLSADGSISQVVVVVGTPPPGMVPTVTAPIVGIQVQP